MSDESDDEQIVHGRWQGVGFDLDLQWSDLADILERYPLKARSSTSTNNATPAYINTIISSVKTADRRIAGEQQSDVDSLLWLNLTNIKGKNLAQMTVILTGTRWSSAAVQRGGPARRSSRLQL
jgi:hypothetical protein